ncbi:chloramphenicol acetyltransferase [Clostridium bowmanii]|uniref:DapH/DapD/GlmU-related protein n=1 Tax=Clostridium bowmanii TaxID=132925 RepID=UPI001C0DC714|nr:chloramphenicol acetyltransferase [Clostridium bowmanii]MCA1073496.1 chloramphenicol acetyltransferase [Clostridium bowmanii]
MIMEKKILTEEPQVHENCELTNSKLGQYTEVGIFNFFENVTLDDYSYTGQFCFVQNAEIGKFSNIAAMVRIGPTDHPIDRPTLHHFTYRRELYGFESGQDVEFFKNRASIKTYIGHDTWIGHGAIIMPGVTIGNGAIVGSGAVVTKDVAPYTIVAGVPAKPIRKRFSEDIIFKLAQIKWWDWSYAKIKEDFNDFLLDIDSFILKNYEKR